MTHDGMNAIGSGIQRPRMASKCLPKVFMHSPKSDKAH